MDEVEKMYKNAGIKKVRQTNIVLGDYPIAVGIENYPPFTAEKQLELIKWLVANGDVCRIDATVKKWLKNKIGYSKCFAIEEAIAELINDLWQDLTEGERHQIKEILE